MKYLDWGLEVKAVADSGEFTGYASTFGNVDLGGDSVMPGAFTATLAQNHGKVPILMAHQTYRIVGFGIDAEQDATGLKVRGLLAIDSDDGRNARAILKAAMAAGHRPGLSIGYGIPEGGAENGRDGTRLLKQIDLYEYSIAAVPMNPQARVTAVKLADADTAIVEAAGELGTWNDLKRFLHKHCGLSKAVAESVTYALRRDAAQAELSLPELAKAVQSAIGGIKTQGELDAFLKSCVPQSPLKTDEDRELSPVEMAKALRKSSERETRRRALIHEFSVRQCEKAWAEATRRVSKEPYTREITAAEEAAAYKQECAFDEMEFGGARSGVRGLPLAGNRGRIDEQYRRAQATRQLFGKITSFDEPAWRKEVQQQAESILQPQLDQMRSEITACKNAGEVEARLYGWGWSESHIAAFKAEGFCEPL